MVTKTSTTAATSNVASEIDARKIENTTQGLASYCFKFLHNRVFQPHKKVKGSKVTQSGYMSKLPIPLGVKRKRSHRR